MVQPLGPATEMHAHPLVRIAAASEVEERLSNERRLEHVQDRLTVVEDRLSLLLGMVSELVHTSRGAGD